MFSSLGFRKLTNGLSFTSRVVNLTVKTQPQVQTLKLSHTFRKPVYNTQAGRRPLFKRQEPESELADLNRIIPKKPRPAKKQAIKEEAKPKIKKRIEKKKEIPVEETRLVSIRVDEVAKKQAKRVEALGEDVSNRRKLRLIKPPVQLEDYITRLNLGVVKTGRFSQKSRAEYESRVMMPVLQFFAGAKDPASFPPESLPEVAFVGRSNVGKSSLINVLADSTAVRVSSKPGLTQQINFYTADDEFHIVDMPGYGFAYAKEEMRESWKNLIETYIAKRRTMKRLYILVDSRHGVKYIDKQFMEMVDSKNVKFQVVMTKCDLVPRQVLARRYCVVLKDLAEYRHSIKNVLMASAHTKAGINNMRKSILHILGAPIKLLPPALGKDRSGKSGKSSAKGKERTSKPGGKIGSKRT